MHTGARTRTVPMPDSTDTCTHARFWKCALQVNPHTYAGAYRGADLGMDAEEYAAAMRDVCLAEGIQVIGLADHGSVASAQRLRTVLEAAGIVVFPGFEVATSEKVHWVCLFPETTDAQTLERYLGRLGLTDTQDGVHPTTLSGHQLLGKVQDELGGFCFAAHATGASGLLKEKQNNLWTIPQLRAAQIPGAVKLLTDNYNTIVHNKDPHYHRNRPIALINAKDVDQPDALRDSRAFTYIKMTKPCFESFVMAFKDPESRVRRSDEMQDHHYSRVCSVSITGGYFDGLSTEFSGHLNAVIGGRGTGKSTLLECIRYALDIPHKSQDATQQGDQIVKENLGQGGEVTVKLQSATQNMTTYTVTRRYQEPPRVFDKHNHRSQFHPRKDLLPSMEIYGQNEIHELAKRPDALSQVLDRFCAEGVRQQAKLDQAYRKLQKNSNQLASARERKDDLEQQITQLPQLEERARLYKGQGLENQLKVVPLLEKERPLPARVEEDLRCLRNGLQGLEESLPELTFLSDTALEGLPHAQQLRQMRQILHQLSSTIGTTLNQLRTDVAEAELKLKALAEELAQCQTALQQRLSQEFAKLPGLAGKDGKQIGHDYQYLLRQIEAIKPVQNQMEAVDTQLQHLEQTRSNLLKEIEGMRRKRTATKEQAIRGINRRLVGKLKVSMDANGMRQPLHDFLQTIPGIGERKTAWVDDAQELTVCELATAIREGKPALMAKTEAWGQPLTSGLADTLARMSPRQLDQLEAIDLKERIHLALNVAHSGEAENYRALQHLSTGQQCTAILHLLLLHNQDPLIMDQPEDNLDNAFIAERIVQELRAAKTRRQFLFATHNANIPVFGDAEWIGVCSASDQGATIAPGHQGSIDRPVIRDQVTSLLEGGKEAFTQRQEKYGFSS